MLSFIFLPRKKTLKLEHLHLKIHRIDFSVRIYVTVVGGPLEATNNDERVIRTVKSEIVIYIPSSRGEIVSFDVAIDDRVLDMLFVTEIFWEFHNSPVTPQK